MITTSFGKRVRYNSWNASEKSLVCVYPTMHLSFLFSLALCSVLWCCVGTSVSLACIQRVLLYSCLRSAWHPPHCSTESLWWLWVSRTPATQFTGATAPLFSGRKFSGTPSAVWCWGDETLQTPQRQSPPHTHTQYHLLCCMKHENFSVCC